MTTTIEQNQFLTEKGRANLAANKEQKDRDAEYISFSDGEERDLFCDPEKIERKPGQYGKMRYIYTVVDLTNFPDMEKKWGTSKTASDQVDKHLGHGARILHVKAKGEGIARKYEISLKED